MFEADKKDIEILRELCYDSRRSYRKIARNLGMATSTVINRVNSMAKEGHIKSSTLSLDYEKLGYPLTALIEVRASKSKQLQIGSEISKIRNVHGVYNITGESDLVVIARFRNREDLSNIVKSIGALEFVERTNTHLVLNVLKDEHNIL